jgi:signal transduction histidine kinase
MAVELRPPILDDLGIVAAMAKYITNFGEQQCCTISFRPPEAPLVVSNHVALALYRILQESLTNIAKHAQATEVQVTLSKMTNRIVLLINDNGRGIREGDLTEAYRNNCLGIYGMKERVELMGGTFEVGTVCNRGTTIRVTLPVSLE